MTKTDNEFETTVKEFVSKLTDIENEITILRQDRSELFAEMKSKLTPFISEQPSRSTIFKRPPRINFFTENLEVLELLNSYILWGN